jgi:hypothetical protein
MQRRRSCQLANPEPTRRLTINNDNITNEPYIHDGSRYHEPSETRKEGEKDRIG